MQSAPPALPQIACDTVNIIFSTQHRHAKNLSILLFFYDDVFWRIGGGKSYQNFDAAKENDPLKF
jgi:hypothetical protein